MARSLLSLVSLFSLLIAAGCSSSSSSTPVDAAPVQDAADAADAADAPDATDSIAFDAKGCTAMRTPAAAPQCGDTCDVRLLLPGGDKYCTITCATDAECTPLGAGLICSTGDAGTSTCVPACTSDAQCVAAGFKRCEPSIGGCDTI